MEANNMNLDQTAPSGAVWTEFILFQYRLSKNMSRQEEQTTAVVTGGLNKSYNLDLKI